VSGLESLDVLIGLITVYLVLALACTAIVEALAAWLDLRSANLETALKEFLAGKSSAGKEFVEAFYDHPLVQALSKGKNGRPSYIPPEIVGQVLLSLITANGAVASLKDAVDKMPGTAADNRIKGILTTLATQASGDVAAFRKAVETQFDAVMDRASGWVKRRQQNVALAVASLLVCLANVDTFTLATALSSSAEMRAKMVEIAEARLKEGQAVPPNKNDSQPSPDQVSPLANQRVAEDALEAAKRKSEEAFMAHEQARVALETGGLQFGWKDPGSEVSLAKALGLLITVLAVSLGAPFWFDVLQRFMQVRQAGVSPREKKQANK
jgi:hypothetical protein